MFDASDKHRPTGEQFELVSTTGRKVRAVVTEIGAILRLLEVDGVPLIEGFAADAEPGMCAGWILVPWPNRIRDGKWTYEGRQLQFEITEPKLNNALHGLLFALSHEVVTRSADSITLRARIEPSEPYPFSLTVDTTYTVSTEGLAVEHTLSNTGETDAPAAIGSHPYFRIGDVPIDDLVVRLRAASRVVVDDRLNPIGAAAVAGTPFDLNHGARVADLSLDTAYFDLEADDDGYHRHTIAAPDGRYIEVWSDESFSQAQVFTTHIFPTATGPGRALALEPTTAAPDAFNSGDGLRWIAPADSWHSSWGISFFNK